MEWPPPPHLSLCDASRAATSAAAAVRLQRLLRAAAAARLLCARRLRAALPPVVPAAVARTAGVERVDAVRVDVPATLSRVSAYVFFF